MTSTSNIESLALDWAQGAHAPKSTSEWVLAAPLALRIATRIAHGPNVGPGDPAQYRAALSLERTAASLGQPTPAQMVPIPVAVRLASALCAAHPSCVEIHAIGADRGVACAFLASPPDDGGYPVRIHRAPRRASADRSALPGQLATLYASAQASQNEPCHGYAITAETTFPPSSHMQLSELWAAGTQKQLVPTRGGLTRIAGATTAIAGRGEYGIALYVSGNPRPRPLLPTHCVDDLANSLHELLSPDPTHDPASLRHPACQRQHRAFADRYLLHPQALARNPSTSKRNTIFTPWRPSLSFRIVKDPDAKTAQPALFAFPEHATPLSEINAIQDAYATQHGPFLLPAITAEALSHPQAEAVAHIVRAHQLQQLDKHHRPTGVRLGFLLGDGTGTGKGRIIAAAIAHAWCEQAPGQRRAIWFSQSPALIHDTLRDLNAVGFNTDIVHHFPDAVNRDATRDENALVHLHDGILFATYAVLRNQAKRSAIRTWLIGTSSQDDASPTLVTDEAHNLKNAFSNTPSQQGQGITELSASLPRARILYSSATGIDKASAYSYTDRLGLWNSPISPHPDRKAFIEYLKTNGKAALEATVRELCFAGLEQIRCLDLTGVENDPLEIALTPEQEAIQDLWARAWQVVHHELNTAIEHTLPKAIAASPTVQIGSIRQSFFAYLISAFKAPELIRAIEDDLQNGLAPIVQLAHTHEAAAKRRLRELEQPTDSGQILPANTNLNPVNDVIEAVRSIFPIYRKEAVSNPDGSITHSVVLDANGTPVINPIALAARSNAIAALKAPTLAPVPLLDALVWHFGDRIAEISGRSMRTRRLEDGSLLIERRHSRQTIQETNDFLHSRRKVLAFTLAGSTGRSYHADRSAPNQDRRVHYIAEFAHQSISLIQGLGRSHRTNATSTPRIRLTTTNLHGERRFQSTALHTLSELGSASRGDQRSQGNVQFAHLPDLHCSSARRTITKLYKALQYSTHSLGVSLEEFIQWMAIDPRTRKTPYGDSSLFWNRLMTLSVTHQQRLSDAFDTIHATVRKKDKYNRDERGIDWFKEKRLERLSPPHPMPMCPNSHFRLIRSKYTGTASAVPMIYDSYRYLMSCIGQRTIFTPQPPRNDAWGLRPARAKAFTAYLVELSASQPGERTDPRPDVLIIDKDGMSIQPGYRTTHHTRPLMCDRPDLNRLKATLIPKASHQSLPINDNNVEFTPRTLPWLDNARIAHARKQLMRYRFVITGPTLVFSPYLTDDYRTLHRIALPGEPPTTALVLEVPHFLFIYHQIASTIKQPLRIGIPIDADSTPTPAS